ncbi:MAG TPA: nucleotidyltransferase family protein [Candidatus Nanoarchaeia archaeon]|nr:nucleotidyltransferase family protein [Candidatus Nanoarchaeia archaeon]
MAHLKPKASELQKIKKIVAPLLRRRGVVKAGIFGSYARGEQKKKSDVDLLVETKRSMSLFDFVGLKLALESRLKKKIDLVEYKAIKPLLKRVILKEEIRVL